MIHVSAPPDVLYRMYGREPSLKCSREHFSELLGKMPESVNPCCLQGDKLISKEMMDDDLYRSVEREQRNVDYYIPVKEEIRSLVEAGYPSSETAYQDLRKFLLKELRIDDDGADAFCSDAFDWFSTGNPVSVFMDIVADDNLDFASQTQRQRLIFLLTRVNSKTRKPVLRGHIPAELEQPRPAAKKIYPNDPCPCGSGKKYKKCCGRKR